MRDTERCEVVDAVTALEDKAETPLCARRDMDLTSVNSPPLMHLDHVRPTVECFQMMLWDKPFGRKLADAQGICPK